MWRRTRSPRSRASRTCSKSPPAYRLRYLKKLDLGRNRIRHIEGLAQLESLTQLSLEDNVISTLNGLEGLQSLMELYIGNNVIQEIREVSLLKPLGKLIILDISGN